MFWDHDLNRSQMATFTFCKCSHWIHIISKNKIKELQYGFIFVNSDFVVFEGTLDLFRHPFPSTGL